MGSLMEIRRRMMQGDALPPKYKRVEYIRNPEWAFLNIEDYIPAIGDEFEINFSYEKHRNLSAALFSSGSAAIQTIALLTSDRLWYAIYFTDSAAHNTTGAISANMWYKMTVSSSGVFEINGVTMTTPPTGDITGTLKYLRIFRRINDESPFIGKLKTFIIRTNGKTKLNLIPCIRRSDSKVGVYNTVSKQFYSSASVYSEFQYP